MAVFKMLAPRKKLWSSPKEVIEAAIQILDPQFEDTCFDIGCGDGRFLFKCCELRPQCNLVGIEIEEQRCIALNEKIDALDIRSRCRVVCGNALEQDYSSATCFFLYLIPHGLRVIYKHVISKILDRRIRVVTYMSPFPAEFVQPTRIVKVQTSLHADADWPLYVYDIYNDSSASTTTPAPTVDDGASTIDPISSSIPPMEAEEAVVPAVEESAV